MWGRGRKRNLDDGFDCPMCGDWTEYDGDVADCSCCGNVFCSDCVGIECAGCKEEDPSNCHICEGCSPFPGCEACNVEDITFCNHHIKDHLNNCNKSSRAQQIVNAETHEIGENERKITLLRAEISSKQAELNRLESMVADSKQRKANAEVELRAAGGS